MTDVLMMGLRRLDVGHLANVLVMNLARSLRDLPRRLLDDVAGGQALLKRLRQLLDSLLQFGDGLGHCPRLGMHLLVLRVFTELRGLFNGI